jgi:hypothetical protein
MFEDKPVIRGGAASWQVDLAIGRPLERGILYNQVSARFILY